MLERKNLKVSPNDIYKRNLEWQKKREAELMKKKEENL